MATRSKQTDQDIIADGKLVAGATRTRFGEIAAADARRKTPFLPETRLSSFEDMVFRFERMVGGQNVAASDRLGATRSEEGERAQVYALVQEIRDEVTLGNPQNPGVGHAFGVGAKLSPQSTPRVLTAAQGILSAWEKPTYRQAALDAGVSEERIETLRSHTLALGEANVSQGLAQGAAVGQTQTKQQLRRMVRSETTYMRRVAKVVFRRQPEALALFANVQPRQAVQPRPRADQGGRSAKAAKAKAEQASKAEQVSPVEPAPAAEPAGNTDGK
ncbi:MAG TPA: hypothetical protein VH877_05940 [Polyangia bacterium]|jgi:hypothetical protein|nr:hypothetical protein [Polyangia bacterium]